MLGAGFTAMATAMVRVDLRGAGSSLDVALCGGSLVELLCVAFLGADGSAGGGSSGWA